MRRPSLVRWLGVGGISLLSVNCHSDTTGPAPLDPAHSYFALQLNHHAITLAITAPYNTLQLTANPLSATGTLLSDTSTTSYTSSDSMSVAVDSTGLIRAKQVAAQVMIIARRTIQGVTFADTAQVNVNNVSPVPVLTTFILQPEPGDSAQFSASGIDFNFNFPEVLPVVLDAQGDTIPNVAIHYGGSDPTVTSFLGYYPYLSFNKPERIKIFADATIYGVSKADTLSYIVGWPLIGTEVVTIDQPKGRAPISQFTPHDDTIAAGGWVTWINKSGQPVDVVFDNPSQVQSVDSAFFSSFCGYTNNYGYCQTIPTQGGGNIPAFASMDTVQYGGVDTLGLRARSFPTVGTYTYHSALYGTTGVIHVLPPFQVP